ncbi:MAG: T9SS type A sorting domain-containing protein [Crocinitomicaceae bacterium]|nr:T9SS type A sorting domain-containing protein [Crocinitomicaceae bacterium]
MLKYLCVSFLIAFGYNANTQTILGDFDIDQSNGKVLLAWTIKSGSVCNGMQIFRSKDSVNFVLIEDIQGVCGDLSSSVSYTYTDQTPILNNYNYYKINFGGLEDSNILGIEVINILSNSYLLKPNPVTGASDLYFENDNQSEVVLKVFDDFGDVIYLKETQANKFTLDSTSFSSGMYYFSLENKTTRNVINGKAVILNQ